MLRILDVVSQIWDIPFVKPAIFHPTAIAAVRQFPEIVRKEPGKAMFDIHCGDTPVMPTFSANAFRCQRSRRA
jgi:hypothetical protein